MRRRSAERGITRKLKKIKILRVVRCAGDPPKVRITRKLKEIKILRVHGERIRRIKRFYPGITDEKKSQVVRCAGRSARKTRITRKLKKKSRFYGTVQAREIRRKTRDYP